MTVAWCRPMCQRNRVQNAGNESREMSEEVGVAGVIFDALSTLLLMGIGIIKLRLVSSPNPLLYELLVCECSKIRALERVSSRAEVLHQPSCKIEVLDRASSNVEVYASLKFEALRRVSFEVEALRCEFSQVGALRKFPPRVEAPKLCSFKAGALGRLFSKSLVLKIEWRKCLVLLN